jgi:hypothetical protein
LSNKQGLGKAGYLQFPEFSSQRVIEIMVLFKISLYPLIFSISWALINYQLGQVQKSLVRSNLNKLFINSPAAFGENGEDIVWIKLRKDAEIEAQREPLLASFMHATILSHSSLEKSLSFHMANQLSSPAMISTQIQALFLEAFDKSESFRSSVRSDILAVMDRDPAVKTSPDVLLYFKGIPLISFVYTFDQLILFQRVSSITNPSSVTLAMEIRSSNFGIVFTK